MKYFTKEWYEGYRNAEWHLKLSVSKNAEEFSEEYYMDLYTRRRRAFVKEKKEMAEALSEPFHKGQAEVEFFRQHEEAVKRIDSTLPKEILAEVADTRVLALDIATKEVRQKLKVWCEQNKKKADEMVSAYQAENGLQTEVELENAVIKTMELKDDTLAFGLDCADVKKVIFKNYKILEQDGYLLGATWLCQEKYVAEGGTQYHWLLLKNNGQAGHLTVFAKEMEQVK